MGAPGVKGRCRLLSQGPPSTEILRRSLPLWNPRTTKIMAHHFQKEPPRTTQDHGPTPLRRAPQLPLVTYLEGPGYEPRPLSELLLLRCLWLQFSETPVYCRGQEVLKYSSYKASCKFPVPCCPFMAVSLRRRGRSTLPWTVHLLIIGGF